MREDLTADLFRPYLDDRFIIRFSDAVVEFRLVQMIEFQQPVETGRMPFQLSFLGPPAPLLPQRTYAFEHHELGLFALFIVPSGPSGAGMRYDAHFS